MSWVLVIELVLMYKYVVEWGWVKWVVMFGFVYEFYVSGEFCFVCKGVDMKWVRDCVVFVVVMEELVDFVVEFLESFFMVVVYVCVCFFLLKV